MYVCGPTVYDYLHIGNFRGAVFYNFLRLWLEKQGYKVRYYYNLTDVDDKIIKKAHQEKTSPEKIAQKYSKTFFEDFHQLKLKPHEGNPKATEFIKEMIELIQELIQKKQAYEASGHVFYRVHQFKNYGKLSRRRTKDMQADFEKEALDLKENKEDFSLWKKSKENEPSWPSPWGPGRPGWHIECTAMVHRCLQTSIDIHGGGMDLIFPHHENEIAQSEGCKKPPFVKYWVHHNMFERGGEKISKSLGKIPAMHDFLSEYNAEIFKYLVFSAHYRSTIEFSEKTILQSMAGSFKNLPSFAAGRKQAAAKSKTKHSLSISNRGNKKNIDRALNDDLNTAKALGFLFSLVRVFNELTKKRGASPHLFLELFKEYGSVFSLFQEDPKNFWMNSI